MAELGATGFSLGQIAPGQNPEAADFPFELFVLLDERAKALLQTDFLLALLTLIV